MERAERSGEDLRWPLCSAERFSDLATSRGLRLVNTPWSRSSAWLSRVTRADHLRLLFLCFWVMPRQRSRLPGVALLQDGESHEQAERAARQGQARRQARSGLAGHLPGERPGGSDRARSGQARRHPRSRQTQGLGMPELDCSEEYAPEAREPEGFRRSDEEIAHEIAERLADDVGLDANGIDVSARHGEVTLRGTVRH